MFNLHPYEGKTVRSIIKEILHKERRIPMEKIYTVLRKSWGIFLTVAAWTLIIFTCIVAIQTVLALFTSKKDS